MIWTLQRDGAIGTVNGVQAINCTIEDTSGLKGIIKGETANGTPGIISGVHFTDLIMDGQSITSDNYLRKVNVGANVENLTYENTEIIEPDYTVYEAETARLGGEAGLVESGVCSGGWKVGSLGGSGDGACLFNDVYANAAGRYTMTVYYSTMEARSFFISVNGGEDMELACEGNGVDWMTISAISLPIRLQKGENTIRFHNSTGNFCPDLDKIEIDNLSLDPPPTPGLVYVSDLPWESATSGWEGYPPQRDLSVEGNPLRIRTSPDSTSKTFAKGIGTHAVSEIILDVSDLACERFQCYVAPDTEATDSGRTSVTFDVYADDRLVFSSGAMGRDDDAKLVDVDITGAQKLRLVAGDNGDGVSNDHADWADAKIITTITAQDIADSLTAPPVEKGQTMLSLPEAPEGYTVTLTGSSSDTIGLDGTITPPQRDEKVILTFLVTKDETDETGTAELMVTVPGIGEGSLSAQEVADTLTAPTIQKGQTTLPLPRVPEGYTVALTDSSSDTVRIDGTITPPQGDEKVTLTYTVVKDGTTDTGTAKITITVPGIEEENPDGRIIIQPEKTDLLVGSSLQFTAKDTADISSTPDVIWKVEGQLTADTHISDQGILYVADQETAEQLTVTAQLREDATAFASAVVTLHLSGDLDGDGKVTIADVMEACKILARKSADQSPSYLEILVGDLDKDERVTIADVMEICKVLARQD